MVRKKRYVVDSDVFITAKNRYYAFDLCPGCWKSVIRRHRDGRVCSIDRVKGELLSGRKTEDLVVCTKDKVPNNLFEGVDDEAVTAKYAEIMLWAQRHAQFTDAAKAKFATGADGWLVAFAIVHRAIVVTNERPAPECKNDIKLPDVCEQFGVEYRDTFRMVRDLAVRFEWEDGAQHEAHASFARQRLPGPEKRRADGAWRGDRAAAGSVGISAHLLLRIGRQQTSARQRNGGFATQATRVETAPPHLSSRGHAADGRPGSPTLGGRTGPW